MKDTIFFSLNTIKIAITENDNANRIVKDNNKLFSKLLP